MRHERVDDGEVCAETRRMRCDHARDATGPHGTLTEKEKTEMDTEESDTRVAWDLGARSQ